METAEEAAFSPNAMRLQVQPGSPSDWELLRWALGPMFDLETVTRAERDAFALTSSAFIFDGFSVGETWNGPARMTRGHGVIARAGLDDILVVSYLAGGAAFKADRGEGEARAGDIVLFDLSRPATLSFPTQQHHHPITLRRREIAKLVDDPELLHGLVLRNGDPLNALLKSYMSGLWEQAPRFNADEAKAAGEGAAALVAACFNPLAKTNALATRGLWTAAFHRVRKEIEARLHDPRLDPGTLCARCGISRATLYRMFEPYGGVGAFIRHARLARAYNLLSRRSEGEDARIAEVALQCGFTDVSTFGRRFREAFHVTPRDMRAWRHRGEPPEPRIVLPTSPGFDVLNRWFHSR